MHSAFTHRENMMKKKSVALFLIPLFVLTACGMSVREDTNLITGDNAHFASHIMVPYDLEDRYRHYFE